MRGRDNDDLIARRGGRRNPNLTVQLSPTSEAAYDWPESAGGEPVLLEAYTFRNIKVIVGLTDLDFDPANPAYHFSNVERVPSQDNSP